MSEWHVLYTEEAKADLKHLNGSIKSQVVKAIRKVSQNPLPHQEGGYGVALGNRNGIDLSGCCKIKLKKIGIRVVYELKRTEQGMEIVIVGARADNEVYEETFRRLGR